MHINFKGDNLMTKTDVLKLLKNTNDYISGQMLCEEFGVSRTAIWKVINQLKEDGYEIESVSNKGYKIINSPDIIKDYEIESNKEFSDGFIAKVEYFDEIDSTNNEAKRQGDDYNSEPRLFITESQTGGRGRRGRKWVSPKGNGIWMSLLFKPDIMPSQASMLTIVAAMAVAAAIKDLLPEADCKIKWPNDIVINERKVCGILTEMSAELEYIHYVVIGIGINVNTTEFPDEIKDIAASIYSLTGVKVNRSQLVVAFSKEFKKFYNIFMVKKDLGDLVNDYDKMLINKGREVSTTGAVAIEGKAVGINSLGELIIKTKDGALESVRAGEVSVRGLYSYV